MPFARSISVLLFGLATASGQAEVRVKASPPVALVCHVEGKVTFLDQAQTSRNVALYDWLPAGGAVTTLDGARLILVFPDGQRWELGPKSQARVSKSTLVEQQGTVRRLKPVPMIPSMAQVRGKGTLGAFTVRGRGSEAFSDLFPGEGDSLVATDAELHFRPLTEATRFRVEIEDESGNSIFCVETLNPLVRVSPGILKPGALYFWRVRTLDGPRPSASAEIPFTTVPDDQAKVRAQLVDEVDRDGDPSLRALLLEMDRWLGLKNSRR